jgi:hypothetical protein
VQPSAQEAPTAHCVGAVPELTLCAGVVCVYCNTACSESKAQAACDVRNSRYDRRLQAAVEELSDAASAAGLPSSSSFPDRLNQAEKVAGKFVAKRIRPALQRAREKELPELLSESREYLKGLWSRLNGSSAGRSRKALPGDLKLPGGSQKEVDKVRRQGRVEHVVGSKRAGSLQLSWWGAPLQLQPNRCWQHVCQHPFCPALFCLPCSLPCTLLCPAAHP